MFNFVCFTIVGLGFHSDSFVNVYAYFVKLVNLFLS